MTGEKVVGNEIADVFKDELIEGLLSPGNKG